MIIEEDRVMLATGFSQVTSKDLSNTSSHEITTTLNVLNHLLDPNTTITESELNQFAEDSKIKKIKLVKRTEQITLSFYFGLKADLISNRNFFKISGAEHFSDPENLSLHVQTRDVETMKTVLKIAATHLAFKDETVSQLHSLMSTKIQS